MKVLSIICFFPAQTSFFKYELFECLINIPTGIVYRKHFWYKNIFNEKNTYLIKFLKKIKEKNHLCS